MLTQICTLNLPDGRQVTAEVTVESPDDLSPVKWSGDVDAVPKDQQFQELSAAVLRIVFKNLARDLGGEFTASSTGEYDSWAE